MLIRFFKSSFHLQYLLLILLGAVLWIRVYSGPCEMLVPGPEAPFYLLLLQLLPNHHLLLSIIGFGTLILAAFALNHIAIRHELVPKNSILTALVLILMMSQSPMVLGMNPLYFAGLFVILAYGRILNTYGVADPTKDVFSAAFLIALASLFHFAAIFLVLLLILSFIIFGTFSLRIILVSVAGIFAVYLYLFVYYFLTDSLEGQYCLYVNWLGTIPAFRINYHWLQLINWAVQALLFLSAVFYLLTNINEWNISIRKMILLNLWFVILCFAGLVYAGDNMPVALLLPAIPMALIISAYLLNFKRISILMEVYFLLWLGTAFINNLFSSIC